jgi:lysophospholipase L1-like esterase
MVSAQSQEPFAQDIRAFQEMDRRNPPTKGEILFIGSSSFTRWGDAQKAFPNHPLINRAFGGSTLLDEARYVDEVVTPYAPKEVVLYCGENDFAADPKLDPIEVFGRFESLFTMIRHRTGTVPFVYVSMKPSPSRWELAPKFRQANALIEAFLKKQPDTTYVDVWPVMLLDGKPDPSIYVEDRLHMNEKGYERWTPLLEKTLL